MSVKPIDIQVNMGHMFDVGKSEHARNASLIEQQHFLDDEADKLSKLKKDRLKEPDKAEETDVHEDASKKGSNEFHGDHSQRKDGEDDHERTLSKDDKMGNIIDVLK